MRGKSEGEIRIELPWIMSNTTTSSWYWRMTDSDSSEYVYHFILRSFYTNAIIYVYQF